MNSEKFDWEIWIKDKRETASYGISNEFSRKEAEELRTKTILFVNKCKEILELK